MSPTMGPASREKFETRIFDPFFTTETDRPRDRGRVMAIAHAVVVKRHQVTLSVETRRSRALVHH